MSYFSQKCKHAYSCFKKGTARQKVYAVVEKDGAFVVLKCNEGSKYKYCLAGGGVEKREDVFSAIKRECLEELNMIVEPVRSLGSIDGKSKWVYKGKEFWVNDHMEIVYAKFVKLGKNKKLGIAGEFDSQDIVAEISKEEMLANVAEFVEYGITL